MWSNERFSIMITTIVLIGDVEVGLAAMVVEKRRLRRRRRAVEWVAGFMVGGFGEWSDLLRMFCLGGM